MYVMMPVNVISKECVNCPRLKVIIDKEYAAGSTVPEIDLECIHYDECSDAVDVWKKGQIKDDKGLLMI